jgi:hypothetical protein
MAFSIKTVVAWEEGTGLEQCLFSVLFGERITIVILEDTVQESR